MIKSFADKAAAALFEGRNHKRIPPDIRRPALRKLLQLNAASELDFLRVPPGNRLERLNPTCSPPLLLRRRHAPRLQRFVRSRILTGQASTPPVRSVAKRRSHGT